MPRHKCQLQSVLRIAAIALVGVLAAVQTCSAFPVPSVAYSFTGTCSDCATETATLTLQNYTLGQPIYNSNFVSFVYTSNLTSITITPANNPNFTITGALPAALPGPSLTTVIIANQAAVQSTTGPRRAATAAYWEFMARTNGSWCSGAGCAGDLGTNGVWNGAAPNTPVVGTLALTSFGLILTLMAWVLLRRSRSAQVS